MRNFSSIAPKSCVGGNFYLGEYSAICLGVNVINDISVGDNSVVGAGSLVVGNIDSDVLAYGAPAKKIRNREIGEPYMSARKKKNNVIPLYIGQ